MAGQIDKILRSKPAMIVAGVGITVLSLNAAFPGIASAVTGMVLLAEQGITLGNVAGYIGVIYGGAFTAIQLNILKVKK